MNNLVFTTIVAYGPQNSIRANVPHFVVNFDPTRHSITTIATPLVVKFYQTIHQWMHKCIIQRYYSFFSDFPFHIMKSYKIIEILILKKIKNTLWLISFYITSFHGVLKGKTKHIDATLEKKKHIDALKRHLIIIS